MFVHRLFLLNLGLLVAGCVNEDGSKVPALTHHQDTGDEALDDTGDSVSIEPLSPIGNLLIEEVYYSGAVPTAGIERYYSDQFIELENVVEAPVMVGGLIIGDAPGLAGGDQPGENSGWTLR